MFCDYRKMSVTLRYRGVVWNGGRPGWDYDRSFRMAFGHSIVNGRAIIRAVGGHRSDAGIDLIEQLRDFRNIAHIVGRQLRGDDVMRARTNTKMQLAPSAVRPDAMFLIQPFPSP